MDDRDASAPADDPTDQLWVIATLGRLAGQGLLQRPAVDADPFGPSERLRSLLPAGAPLAAVHVFVRELLAMQSRYAEGAPAGWADTDPELIRSRGAASGAVVLSILDRCRPHLP